MRNLEFQSVQDQLDRAVLTAAVAVKHEECLVRPGAAANAGAAACRLDPLLEFEDRLNAIVPALNGDRLLLLDASQRVVYDSGGATSAGTAIALSASRRVANVGEARATLDGQPYLAAAVQIAAVRDPMGARFVVLAEPQASIASAAAGDLAARLVLAGGAALVVALLLVLLVSRTLTRPLTQLSSAAEDIAAGNYSRRVELSGSDEIGALGGAFNRMAEAVEKARRVQREFLANVSHELKTPLTSLIGFSQALVDGSLSGEAERARAAAIVHEESERVLRMAQELLDLARVEAGSISMHLTAVDLGADLQQQMEFVRPRAEARHLELSLGWPTEVPPVKADPERLHQVLDNLLDNAVKYAPEGSAVTVSARLTDSMVETVVANPAGPHLPDPDRMFERFYRAEGSRSGPAGGVGLGLSISRELSAAMGGRLWADLDPAGMLRLHLVLPAATQPSPNVVPEPPAQPAPEAVAS